MDGAWLGSVDIAIKKAKTATFFQMNTEVIGSLSQPGGSLYNIEHSNSGLISFPGGLPLTTGDGIIGGTGGAGTLGTGGVYDPATDTWTRTSPAGGAALILAPCCTTSPPSSSSSIAAFPTPAFSKYSTVCPPKTGDDAGSSATGVPLKSIG